MYIKSDYVWHINYTLISAPGMGGAGAGLAGAGADPGADEGAAGFTRTWASEMDLVLPALPFIMRMYSTKIAMIRNSAEKTATSA